MKESRARLRGIREQLCEAFPTSGALRSRGRCVGCMGTLKGVNDGFGFRAVNFDHHGRFPSFSIIRDHT